MAMGSSGSFRSGSRSKIALSEINVTPLVDVMLVLLIIFMVAAPMMQQGLPVQLPQTRASGMPTEGENPFILVIQKSGKIYFGTTDIQMENLKEKLAAIFEKRQDRQIYIQADRKVDYGTVAEVMAEIKAAGIQQISFVTQAKGEAK